MDNEAVKLVPINEDNSRDINLHFSDCVLYDHEKECYAFLGEFGGRQAMVKHQGEDDYKAIEIRKDAFEQRFSGVAFNDQYYQFGGACALVYRIFDRKYKKASSRGNSQYWIPEHRFLAKSRNSLKMSEDIFNNVEFMESPKYFTFDTALALLSAKKKASCVLSPDTCISRYSTHPQFYFHYKGRRVGICNSKGNVLIFVPELKEHFQELGVIN